MFHQARIKLTAFYLVIIMLISLSFSMIIYRGSVNELSRIERVQRFRRPFPTQPAIDPELIEETKARILMALVILNAAILGLSGTAGYFLAGKTLKPIAQMMNNQKQFVTDASHELRTPLTAIKTENEVALRDKNLNLKGAKALLISNLEEVGKMQKLTNYLLSLTRYQDGKGDLKMAKLDLAKVAAKVVSRFEEIAKRKKITIKKELTPAHVLGHETALEELTAILLDNAIKYSPPKSEIKVKTEKRNKALLEVKDEGIGIKKEEIPFIFNRFYRADSSRNKEKTEGYGLGLAIAKNIVDTHHGKIEVKSCLGKGTSFTVRI